MWVLPRRERISKTTVAVGQSDNLERLMRRALAEYGQRVTHRGIDRFTIDDADVVRTAWTNGVAPMLAAVIVLENRARGWPARVAKDEDVSIPSILLDNPYAVAFLEREGAELVREIDEATRNTIREFIKRGLEEHLTAKQTARALRAVISLTSRQAASVDALLEAGIESGEDPDRLLDRAERYSQRLLAQRAMLIGRTETIRASAAGLQASWFDASRRGLLPMNAKQEWIGGGGARTCDVCSGLIGKQVPLGGSFGPCDRPPAHPACRCTLGLVFT